MSTAHREEFEYLAKCLGLSTEEIVYASWKTVPGSSRVGEGQQSHRSPRSRQGCQDPHAAAPAAKLGPWGEIFKAREII